jgi:hypothetical protein
MAVFNGSHAVASTTAAATLVRTQMQTTIPSHANWTLVESTTMNAGAVPCDVYKCSSVGNGLGADFYAAVMQSGVNLYFGVAEGYNTSTHKPKRAAVHAPVTLNTLQADGGFMSATTEIDWFNGTFNPGGAAGTAMASVASNAAYSGAQIDDWKVMVGADCFYFAARSTAYYGYVGPYDSLVATPATNDPLPLVMVQCQLASSQAIHTAALRQPLCGSQSIGYATNCNGGGSGGSEAAATLSSVLWAAARRDGHGRQRHRCRQQRPVRRRRHGHPAGRHHQQLRRGQRHRRPRQERLRPRAVPTSPRPRRRGHRPHLRRPDHRRRRHLGVRPATAYVVEYNPA